MAKSDAWLPITPDVNALRIARQVVILNPNGSKSFQSLGISALHAAHRVMMWL